MLHTNSTRGAAASMPLTIDQAPRARFLLPLPGGGAALDILALDILAEGSRAVPAAAGGARHMLKATSPRAGPSPACRAGRR